MNKALAFVLLGALCAAGLPTSRKKEFSPAPLVEERQKKEFSPAPPVEERQKKEFSPAPPVEERQMKEFSPAPPVEERKNKGKKSKEEFIPVPDTITGAP